MGSPIHVLYVDADADVADLTATHLEREDDRFTVETAASTTAGLDRLDADVDCVVSAYEFPDTDGLAFLEAVREDYPDLPSVLFPGKGSEAVAADAIDAGVTNYLQRRDGTDQYAPLAARIREAVAQYRSQHSRERELARYETAVEAAGDPIYTLDADGIFTLVNDAFCEVTGYDETDLVGAHFASILAQSDRLRGEEVVRSLRDPSVDRRTSELTLVCRDGSPVPCEIHLTPLPTRGDGSFCGTVGVVRDISARTERERELERERDRFETLLERVPTPLVYGHVIDDGIRVTRVNAAFEDVFGYDADTLVGEYLDEYIVPAEHGDEADTLNVTVRREGNVEHEVRRETTDGMRDFLFRAIPLHETGEDTVEAIGVYTDITEQKERERAMREQRERLQEREEKLIRLRNYTQDLAYADTPAETATVALNAIDEILGFDLGAVFTQSETQEGVLEVVEVLNQRQMEKMYGGIPVFLRDAPAGTHSELAWEVFESGESVFLNDTAESDLLARKSPFGSLMLYPIGDHGVVLLAATTLEAFTETEEILLDLLAATLESAFDRLDWERELRRQRDALERQNERLEEFASVVSHDLRNPLQVADLRLELAREECDSDHLGDVADALDRSQALVDDLLTLAREGEPVGETEPVDLGEVAEICWHTTAAPDATFRVETDRTVLADRSRLRQLFENLYRNAVEHAGDDVTITVGATDEGFYVEDDGPGIPAEERESVFEGGYSTTADGTGFGLRIVEQVATAHGWEVRVTDGTGGGARFEVSGVDVAE